MGFPYGIDEEAAFMVSWLELHKLDGVKNLANISKKINKKFDAKINKRDLNLKKSINLKKTSLLMKGPILFDYLYEKNKNSNNFKILLENSIDPIFIIPLVGKFSNKIKFINAYWLNNNKIIGMKASKKKILIGEIKNKKILKGLIFLQFTNSSKKDFIKLNKITHKINYKNEQKFLKDSLNPKLIHWNIISKLAQKTFVSSSDVSRNKGAGGGNDND